MDEPKTPGVWDKIKSLPPVKPEPEAAPATDNAGQQKKNVGPGQEPGQSPRPKRGAPKGHRGNAKRTPYRFDKRTANRIVSSIRIGATFTQAAASAGISGECLRDWLYRGAREKRGPMHDWLVDVDKAKVDYLLKYMYCVDRGVSETLVDPATGKQTIAVKDPRLAFDVLKSRDPSNWTGGGRGGPAGGDGDDDGDAVKPIVHIVLPDNGRNDPSLAEARKAQVIEATAPPRVGSGR